MWTKKGQTIGMIIGRQWMKSLRHIYNPNLLCITSWERCSMFGMEIIDFKFSVDKSMKHAKNKSSHACPNHKLGVWCKHGQSWCYSIHNGWAHCVSTIAYSLNITSLWHRNNPSNFHVFLLWAHRAMERAHVVSRFVHFICKLNMVGLTILIKWKNVLKKEQYNECIKKVGKTWYHLTILAMTENLFKVNFLPSIQYSLDLSLCCEISCNFYIL